MQFSKINFKFLLAQARPSIICLVNTKLNPTANSYTAFLKSMERCINPQLATLFRSGELEMVSSSVFPSVEKTGKDLFYFIRQF